jgi:multiple sugar transport system substrate-binding protein
MKYLFALGALLFIVTSVATRMSYPGLGDGSAVLYWVTDPSPARNAHVQGFEAWQIDHGHVDEQGRPLAQAVVDPNNGTQDKIVVQGVAGVGSDIIDTRWGRQLRLFEAVGILKDTTDIARERGFSPADTWAAAEPEITIDGRQFMYPCNVAVRLLWVNTALFRTLNMPIPEAPWSFDAFETMGVQFVERGRAHRPGEAVFFCDDVPLEIMYRSLGLSLFNETLTACDLDDPRYVETLERRKRWVYDLNILPSPDDQASVTAEGSWGGLSSYLFRDQRLGLFYSGRYMLIQFRRFALDGKTGPMELDVVAPPSGGFPNVRTTVRGAGIYTAGPNIEHAQRFVEYLASERYNQMIIDDADALPPNPEFVKSESFLRPADWPNEWGIHERFVEAMDELAIAGVYSEFVLSTVAERIVNEQNEDFENGLSTAEDAARRTARLIDARIARNLEEDVDLLPLYRERVALQERIDRRFAAGEKVPASWIKNPFYSRYYAAQGMLIDDEAIDTDTTAEASTEGGDA